MNESTGGGSLWTANLARGGCVRASKEGRTRVKKGVISTRDQKWVCTGEGSAPEFLSGLDNIIFNTVVIPLILFALESSPVGYF